MLMAAKSQIHFKIWAVMSNHSMVQIVLSVRLHQNSRFDFHIVLSGKVIQI